MCFSAGASFGASVIIGSAGVVAYKKANTTSQKVFAMIPLLFAVQQFGEGIVWLGLMDVINEVWVLPATYLFLIFAWIIWPVFIPFSLRLLEQDSKRRKQLNILSMIGGGVSITLIYLLLSKDVSAAIVGNHIKYRLDFTSNLQWIFAFVYLLPVVFPHFVSSIKKMWILGAINIASYAYSKLMYNDYVVSIWCFFAAVSSVVIMVIIYEMQKESKKQIQVTN